MISISWSPPDPNLELLHVSASNDSLLLTVKSIQTSSSCPVCSKLSTRIHSQYTRKVQDLPISDKSVGLLIMTKRWFCDQPDCQVKIFIERYDWLSSNGDVLQGRKKFLVRWLFQLVAFQLKKWPDQHTSRLA